MEYSTLIARLKTASESFENLEVQLADPDIANDPRKLEWSEFRLQLPVEIFAAEDLPSATPPNDWG